MIDLATIDDAFSRHERIALQVSGGRDSLAVLYLLRAYWDRLTVYWCNTGNAFPETQDIMSLVRDEVPHFVEINGDQPSNIAAHGFPSDIVPVSNTVHGLAIAGSLGPLLQDRYSCCWRTMMQPTDARMKADGITLIIRGQRNSDALKSPLRSGAVADRFELLFPIEDWSEQQVMDYLQANRLPIPRFYKMLKGAPDCMNCSAYWDHGVAAYLKQYHPVAYQEVQSRLDIINKAVHPHIAAFNTEVST